jgi:asparagine synthase (glutamine-hydrolysing)
MYRYFADRMRPDAGVTIEDECWTDSARSNHRNAYPSDRPSIVTQRMSGIAGIVRMGGSTVVAATLESVTATLNHRGPDGSGIVTAGTVGLGQQRRYTTPESKHEATPETGDNYLLTTDVRIDNREELLGALGLSDGTVITDADIVVAAYDEWGVRCPERLVGAYAFALWDRDRRRLFCARDHAGIKPFYYHSGPEVFVFGSEPGAVLAHGEVSRRIEDRAVGDFLLGVCEDEGQTVYGDLQRLRPAHTLVVDEGGTNTERYWRLDPEQRTGLDSTRAHVEEFRRRFETAVDCRLRRAERTQVGSLLSGGLDSSAVACTAADSEPEPLPTFSLTFDSIPDADEREFIEAVLDHGEFDPEFVPGDDHSPMESLDEALARLERPFVSNNLFLHWELYRRASATDVTVLLDGHGGDTTVSYGAGWLTELAVRGRVLTLAREISAIARRYGNPRRRLLRNEVVEPLVPPAVSRWRCRLRGQPEPAERLVSTLDPEFVERCDLRQRSRAASDRRPLSERMDHYRALSSWTLQEALEVADATAATFGVEPRYPFLDRRLMEYCLALPPELKLRDGWSRWVLRESMAGTVPSAVRWRLRKADLNCAFRDGLDRDRKRIREVLEGNGDCQYIELDGVRQSLASSTGGEDLLSSVWRPVVLRRWLQVTKNGQSDTRR